MLLKTVVTLLLCHAPASIAGPVRTNPFDSAYGLRSAQQDPLTVDLGYAIYEGYTDQNASLNVWKGIRYAAPPLGPLRFQAPRIPETNRSDVQPAKMDGMQCPPTSWTGSGGMAGSEDCLYLNVFAPEKAQNLPVFVYIHGGGYARGNASLFQPESIMSTNENGFVSVIIQYRVGAFGFLASEEVKSKGTLNAGLLDQRLVLQWVQKYIGLFGGDPTRVTISGQSAGGGSVMNLAIAYGGNDDGSLFQNGITASPYLPQYFDYNDPDREAKYRTFAEKSGCGNSQTSIFECLQSAKTEDLISANDELGKSELWGLYTFRPVVDGDVIPSRPSTALLGKLNGKRILTGNNADEGWLFTPQNITTQALFVDYLKLYFPRLTDVQISSILDIYATPDVADDPSKPRFWTSGETPPTALNQSGLATGHQQVANNFYGEVSFFCPSYWLAEAFQASGTAYQYQYSVIPSYHGVDISAYIPDPADPVDPALETAFQRAWGRFITANEPSDWPRRTAVHPVMENVNITGGTPVTENLTETLTVTKLQGPGIKLDFRDVDADSWEGGRAARCNFLRTLSEGLVI